MSDPFLDELDSAQAAGPFRTNEPTMDVRLAKARAASLERVARGTREQFDAEQHRERWIDRVLWWLLALSAVALAVVLVLALVGDNSWLALLCPAVSIVVSFAIAVFRRRTPRP